MLCFLGSTITRRALIARLRQWLFGQRIGLQSDLLLSEASEFGFGALESTAPRTSIWAPRESKSQLKQILRHEFLTLCSALESRRRLAWR